MSPVTLKFIASPTATQMCFCNTSKTTYEEELCIVMPGYSHICYIVMPMSRRTGFQRYKMSKVKDLFWSEPPDTIKFSELSITNI